MLCFHIQNDTVTGIEMQKAVGIFTCLGNKHIGGTDAKIAVNGRKNTAYRNGWVRLGLQKDLADHGGGGCLAMCAGYGDGAGVIVHDLP